MFLSFGSLRVEVIPVTMIRQNCMLIWDQNIKKGVISDPGGDLSFIIETIQQCQVDVESIILTHGHFDHVGVTMALQQFLQTEYQHNVPIFGPHQGDEFLLRKVQQDTVNFGIKDIRDVHNVLPTRFLNNQEVLTFSGMSFNVMHIPGHTPGHVVFYEASAGFIITGDVLFRGTIGRSDFPYGNGDQLIQGIKNKLLLLGDDIYVLPGHGISSTIEFERLNNPFLR